MVRIERRVLLDFAIEMQAWRAVDGTEEAGNVQSFT